MTKAFCLFIFYFFGFYNANSQTINWEENDEKRLIGDQLEIFTDSSGVLSIADVAGGNKGVEFERWTKKMLDFPYDTSVKWLKINVQNRSDNQLIFEVAQPILPQVTFYYQDSLAVWHSEQAGYKNNLYLGEITHHQPVFRLPPSNSDFFVRIETTGTPIPMMLWEEKAFEINQTHRLLIFGLYLGIMFFIVMQNIFFFASLRRYVNLLYALIILAYTFFSGIYEGYILYIFPTLDLWQWMINIPNLLSPNVLLYCLMFLSVRKLDPKMFRVSMGLMVYFLLAIVVCKFLPRLGAHLLNQFNALFGLLFFTYIGYRSYKRGNKLGFYFALAYLIYLIISTIEVLYTKTGYPTYVLDISYISLAFLVEVIMLSYLLSKRFEWEKNDNEKLTQETQRQLLEKTKENERIVKDQNVLLEKRVNERTLKLNKSLEDLKQAQNQLIQSEKMASLGELTAGIAHEIQNPLNFVNNFSEVSAELIDEMNEEIEKGDLEEVKAIAFDVKENLQKINHHGNRASSIVKGMLEHSRSSSGKKELTDINALADEYLRLAYHGLRAKDSSFNADFNTNFAPTLPKIKVISQDIGRVLLNLIYNAFQAVQEEGERRKKQGDHNYKPQVLVTTSLISKKPLPNNKFTNNQSTNNHLQITITDNGPGIPDEIKDKIFQPFFTTKETGKGTGLGLSLAYDIMKAHGGEINISSLVSDSLHSGTSFKLIFPLGQKT